MPIWHIKHDEMLYWVPLTTVEKCDKVPQLLKMEKNKWEKTPNQNMPSRVLLHVRSHDEVASKVPFQGRK